MANAASELVADTTQERGQEQTTLAQYPVVPQWVRGGAQWRTGGEKGEGGERWTTAEPEEHRTLKTTILEEIHTRSSTIYVSLRGSQAKFNGKIRHSHD